MLIIRRSFHACAVVALFLLAGCTSGGPGPIAWIDRPLDQSHHPLGPVEVLAHASSASGVASFAFSLDGEPIDQVSVGAGRFESTQITWTPEQPGVYTIGVQASDSAGAIGGLATSIVYIGGVGLEPHSFEETTYGQCEGVEVMQLHLESPMVPRGACTPANWLVVAPEDWPVTFDGTPVEHTGERVVCAEETTPLALEVRTPGGECQVWQVLLVDELQVVEPPPGEAEFGIDFNANPPVIPQGECSVLTWQVHAPDGLSVALDGSPVDYLGEHLVCPEVTTEYELLVRGLDEPQAAHQVVEVISEGEVAPTEVRPEPSATPPGVPTSIPSVQPTSPPPTQPPPPSQPTSTPTNPPADNSGPSISGASVNPSDFVFTSGGGCSPETFHFSVTVSDPSGVTSVQLNWTGNGVRNGPITMNYSHGQYVYDLGLFKNSGSLSGFSIRATDTRGNTSTINPGWHLDVEQCGGG